MLVLCTKLSNISFEGFIELMSNNCHRSPDMYSSIGCKIPYKPQDLHFHERSLLISHKTLIRMNSTARIVWYRNPPIVLISVQRSQNIYLVRLYNLRISLLYFA